MMAVKLLVKIAVMMMAPGGTPAPPEARGESPSEIGSVSLSLSISAFSDSSLSPFLIFPEIRNSDWAEILTRSLSGY